MTMPQHSMLSPAWVELQWEKEPRTARQPLETPLLDAMVETHHGVESEVRALRRLAKNMQDWAKEQQHGEALAINAEFDKRLSCECGRVNGSCRLYDIGARGWR